jgi:serine/threonine protein kinase
MSRGDPHESPAEITLLDRILSDWMERVEAGEQISSDRLMDEHPEHRSELLAFFGRDSLVRQMAGVRVAHDTSVVAELSTLAETGVSGIASADTATLEAEAARTFRGPFPIEFGPYRILSFHGRGAMGEVYVAEDTRLGRRVALKVPRRSVLEEPQLLARFLREARASAGLRHQNICPVYEVNRLNGIHYIALAFIEGKPLSDLVGDPRWRSPGHIASTIGRIAQALDLAHTNGVVHRDLKPANVMIDSEGEPIVMDFGLARQRHTEESSRITQEGIVLGTPAYMSPEQIRSEMDRVGPASDVYSLGVILFELLTGRLPFGGPLISILLDVSNDEKSPPRPSSFRSDVNPRLEAICLRMIAKSPAARYGSMKEVVAALRAFEAMPAASPVQPPSSRSRTGVALAAFGALLLLGVIVITIRNRDGSTRTIETSDTSEISFSRNEKPEGVERNPPIPPSQSPSKPMPDSSPAVAETPRFLPKASPGAGAAPRPAVAPFDSTQALGHQEAWAKYLNVPVRFTNSLGMTFVLIPPGEFLMGTTPEEVRDVLLVLEENDDIKHRCARSELPRHKVVLTRPYYLGTHEITQAQYQQIVGSNPSGYVTNSPDTDILTKLGGGGTSKHPVDNVSWRDAVDFCNRVNHSEGLKPTYAREDSRAKMFNPSGYRLPTEAEWEFACRAGTMTPFWNGDDIHNLSDVEWTRANSGLRPHDVGELKPNPFGLYDMLGNVAEWVYDGWTEDWYASFREKTAVDPTGSTDEYLGRVTRGGNFYYHAIQARSGARFVNDSGVPYVLLGIRLVLPIDSSPAAATAPDVKP